MEPNQPPNEPRELVSLEALIEMTACALYTGYCQHTDFKSLATGDDLPAWGTLLLGKPHIAEAWRASAKAGIEFLESNSPIDLNPTFTIPRATVRPIGEQLGMLEGLAAPIAGLLGVPKEMTVTLRLDAESVVDVVKKCILLAPAIEAQLDEIAEERRQARAKSPRGH